MYDELPKIKCPHCKNIALEVHGEIITSSGRHYPAENCLCCGFSPESFDDREWITEEDEMPQQDVIFLNTNE